MLRKQKEDEKKIEFKVTPDNTQDDDSNQISQSIEKQPSTDTAKLSDFFAPQGLKTGANGKLQIDKKSAQKKEELKMGSSDDILGNKEEAKRLSAKQDLKVI